MKLVVELQELEAVTVEDFDVDLKIFPAGTIVEGPPFVDQIKEQRVFDFLEWKGKCSPCLIIWGKFDLPFI